MSACCHHPYNKTFDRQTALKEKTNYLKNGPKKNSRPLIIQLKNLNPDNLSLLDIGGGIGTIIFELFETGLKKAQYIDISDSYSTIFREETMRRALSDKIDILTGDFLDHHKSIQPADLITLDKVICCYKDFEQLVSASVWKCKKYYAYTIPFDIWWVKLVHFFAEKFRRIRGNEFKTFIHPANEIEKIITTNRFRKIYEKRRREWLTVIFEKKV